MVAHEMLVRIIFTKELFECSQFADHDFIHVYPLAGDALPRLVVDVYIQCLTDQKGEGNPT